VELCVIAGDGIGPEVVPAALRVLQAAVPDVVAHEMRAGWDCFQETGSPLPEETVACALAAGAVLFGAASSPSHPVEGYYSPVVRLRRVLDTYAAIRPTRFLPVPTAREGVDLIVVRENTEDTYAGTERVEADASAATTEKIVSRKASERIARAAYRLAADAGRARVTIVHKANVLPRTDGLFRQVALDVAAFFPDIETDELLIDTAAYWMVKDPLRFDVIVTLNVYGDILSDMAAAWGGGLGYAPTLNAGDGVAMAEPVHGSAPDIAGRGIANPTAVILSAAMLARHHWGLADAASRIENAVFRALADGATTADVSRENALSTEAYTDAVLARL
jgi:homoisocitrate dehydrogenase